MKLARPVTEAIRRGDALLYLFTGLLTAVFTVTSLKLWKATMSVPLSYSGDAVATSAHFKTILEEGWYEHQPRLGAPFGQYYNDFPTADNLHMIAAKVIGLFTDNWAVALNTYFAVGFVLIALAAVWFFRTCGISPLLSAALAIVYAIAPYHFMRGEAHLFLGSYYGIPLGLGLLVIVLKRAPLWGRGRSQNGVVSWVFSPATRTVLWVGILATSSSYYAIFFLILLAFTGIAVLVRDRAWPAFWGATITGAVTALVMLANMLPDLIFSWQNGANPGGFARSPIDTEIYSLKLAALLLPWSGHRITFLRDFRQNYDATYPLISEMPALGLLAASGFVAGIVILLLLLVTRRRPWNHSSDWDLVAGLSALLLVAFLFSTAGGVSTFISFLTSSLRGWNRMSIVLALLSLGLVGLLLDKALTAWFTRYNWQPVARRTTASILCIGILGVAYVDQTPPNVSADYAATQARFEADSTWFTGVEASLPQSSLVLMLPYIPFPETQSVTGFLASDQLLGYLHTKELRWSNGGIKGRPAADWPEQLSNYAPDDLATLAATADVAGIVIQRAAFADRGAAVEASLVNATATPPRVSDNGEYAFFDIQALRGEVQSSVSAAVRAEASTLITRPVVAYPTLNLEGSFDADGAPVFGTRGLPSAFSLVNDTDSAMSVTLSFTVSSAVPGGTTTVKLPDGNVLTQQYDDHEASFTTELLVPTGTSMMELNVVDSRGGPVASATVANLSVESTVLTAYLARVGG